MLMLMLIYALILMLMLIYALMLNAQLTPLPFDTSSPPTLVQNAHQ